MALTLTRLNGRQFFDVWIGATQGVHCALQPNALPVDACRWAVGIVVAHHHGPEAGNRAMAYFDRLLADHAVGRLQ